MNHGVTLTDGLVSKQTLEFDLEEFSQLYNAIHRIVHGSEPEIIEKYANQDRGILLAVLENMDQIRDVKMFFELMKRDCCGAKIVCYQTVGENEYFLFCY